MYRCGICNTCSEPRQSMLRHVVYRTAPRWENSPLYGSIAREIPLCAECAMRLKNGIPLATVIRQGVVRPAPIPSLVGQAIVPIGKRALRPSERNSVPAG